MKIQHLLIPAILFLASCGKEELSEVDFQRGVEKQTSDPWSGAANTQNPYESLSLGIYHNNALNYFRDRRDSYSNQQDWIDATEQITLDFFCAGSDMLYCDSSITVDILSAIADTSLNDSLLQISLAPLPQGVKQYLDRLWDIFDIYTPGSYTALKTEIVQLEVMIVQDDSLLEMHKKMLLCGTQVARYSGLYWKKQFDNNFAGWQGVQIEVDLAELSGVAKADVRGAIVGFKDGAFDEASVTSAAKGGPIASERKLTMSIQ